MSIAERSPTTIAAFSFPSPMRFPLVTQQQLDPSGGSRLPRHLPWDQWDPHTRPCQTLLSDGWLSTVSVAQIQASSLSRVGRAPTGRAVSPGVTQLPPPLPREPPRVRALLVRGDGAVTCGRPARPRGPGARAGGSFGSTGDGPSGGGTGPGAAGSGRSRTSSDRARRRGLARSSHSPAGCTSGCSQARARGRRGCCPPRPALSWCSCT